jgi:tetratricopeptide (TPR) repeat protein
MASARIDVLRSMTEQNPRDAFSRYGLAMELLNSGHLEAAAEEFFTLLRYNPNYAAGYFHGGQTLEKMGRIEDAKKLYREGVVVTTSSGDSHTRSELEAALDLLG